MVFAFAVPVTGLSSGIAEAYFLQYSRAGLKSGMFESPAKIMYEHKLNVDSIPESRRKELELSSIKGRRVRIAALLRAGGQQILLDFRQGFGHLVRRLDLEYFGT